MEILNFFSENKSTFTPLERRHKLNNPGLMKLELIEVHSGTNLD